MKLSGAIFQSCSINLYDLCVDKVEYHLLSVHVHVSITLYSYGLNFVVYIRFVHFWELV